MFHKSACMINSTRHSRLVTRGLITSVGLCLSLILTSSCYGIYAYIPLEVRMLEADYVVEGKIDKLGMGFQREGRDYEVGELTIHSILKGGMEMKKIRVAWPKPPGGGLIIADGPPKYSVGQDGIWILRADDKLPVYWADYPTDRQPKEKLDELQAKIDSLEKIEWTKPVDGLQLGLFVEQRDMRNSKVVINGKPVKAVAQLSVYPLLKNANDKPLHAVNYIFDEPFQLSFSGPDGKPIDVKLYGERPADAPKPALTKYNFIHIPADKIRSIPYGFGLPMLTEEGEYTVSLNYRNAHDGKALDIDSVWGGELESGKITVDVPPKSKSSPK